MILNLDLVYEIILNADYQTTLNLLEIYPNFNIKKLWKDKCQKLYPSKTYLSNFSSQENFLLKERTFTITIEDGDRVSFSDCLIEYYPILEHQMKIMQGLDMNIFMIKINIERSFIIFKYDWNDYGFNIFAQSDSEEECSRLIEDNANEMQDDCGYYIIDVNLLTLDYDKANFIKDKFVLASEYNDKL
jgi:hypothetical protein